MFYLSAIPNQFIAPNGMPYSHGRVDVFISGTQKRASLYSDALGKNRLINPAPLDSSGSWIAYVSSGVALDYIVRDKFGNIVFKYYCVQDQSVSDIVHDSTLTGNGEANNPLGVSSEFVSGIEQKIELAVSGEASERELADEEILDELNGHVQDKDNPHQVTASQVGAYTKSETDDAISDALSGNVGGWLGNLTVAQVNALTTHRKGDSATMLDSGIVNPGNLSVDVGDDIMWVDSLSEWQAKISDHLHHDSTLVGTGATSDPLGVNPQTIASAISTHDSSTLAHADIRQAISDEATARDSADDEIIESLEDETTARKLNDELLSQQIQEVAVQTDWEEDDPLKLEFLKNKPSPISTLEIDALFV